MTETVKNFKQLDFPPPIAGPEHYGAVDCPSRAEGYGCTLDKGHKGRHEAAGVAEIFATWETE